MLERREELLFERIDELRNKENKTEEEEEELFDCVESLEDIRLFRYYEGR